MRNSLTLFIFGLVLSFISCQKEETSTPSSLPNKVAGAKEPVEPDQTDPYTNTVVYNPPTTPTVSNATPFILSGSATSSFTPDGAFNPRQMVAFIPVPATASFPFVPPTGATKLGMGLTFTASNLNYVVKAYPFAVSNGNAYWSAGAVNCSMQAALVSTSPVVYTAEVSTSPTESLGGLICSNCGPVTSGQGQVTVSLLKIGSDGKLTLKATVSFLGNTISIDRVGWSRVH